MNKSDSMSRRIQSMNDDISDIDLVVIGKALDVQVVALKNGFLKVKFIWQSSARFVSFERIHK